MSLCRKEFLGIKKVKEKKKYYYHITQNHNIITLKLTKR